MNLNKMILSLLIGLNAIFSNSICADEGEKVTHEDDKNVSEKFHLEDRNDIIKNGDAKIKNYDKDFKIDSKKEQGDHLNSDAHQEYKKQISENNVNQDQKQKIEKNLEHGQIGADVRTNYPIKQPEEVVSPAPNIQTKDLDLKKMSEKVSSIKIELDKLTAKEEVSKKYLEKIDNDLKDQTKKFNTISTDAEKEIIKSSIKSLEDNKNQLSKDLLSFQQEINKHKYELALMFKTVAEAQQQAFKAAQGTTAPAAQQSVVSVVDQTGSQHAPSQLPQPSATALQAAAPQPAQPAVVSQEVAKA